MPTCFSTHLGMCSDPRSRDEAVSPTIADYCAAAETAAEAWGLGPVSARLLNLSENVVLRLDGERGPLVMRLHRPGYNSLAELESEVAWVSALRDGGVSGPVAVPSADGSFYRPVEITSTGGEAEARYAGVIEWIGGKQLREWMAEGDGDIVPHFAALGRVMGRIRTHGRTWEPPATFVRRRWDADGFVGESPIWGRFWEASWLTPERHRLFSEARDQLTSELGGAPRDEDAFGMIHADLHLANVMVDGSALTVIDFDDSGWGWAGFELAVALHEVVEEPEFEAARDALLTGYADVAGLDDRVEAMVDTFITVRALMLVGWLADRPEVADRERIETLTSQAESRCRLYLA